MGATKEAPALLDLDGHVTRKQRDVIKLCRKYNVYCLIMPSHTSTLHQTLDRGAFAAFDAFHKRIYTTRYAFSPFITVRRKLKLVISALNHLASKHELLRKAWKSVGQPNGLPQPSSFDMALYRAGRRFRSDSLPLVTNDYLRTLFSAKSMACAPKTGFPVHHENPRLVHIRSLILKAIASRLNTEGSIDFF